MAEPRCGHTADFKASSLPQDRAVKPHDLLKFPLRTLKSELKIHLSDPQINTRKLTSTGCFG